MSARMPAVAGSFYPARPDQLDALLGQCFDQVILQPNMVSLANQPMPKVLILPHAGYIYSGAVAAAGYQLLRRYQEKIKKVVLLGPAHRVAFLGIALPSVTQFLTPMGTIALDQNGIEALSALSFVQVRDDAHAKEHSLEVHLPFLQYCLNDFTLLPMVVGMCDTDKVAQALELVWGGEETLVIISSDLSHFHPYDAATQIDANTIKKILACDTDIQGEQACGCFPLNGFLKIAKSRHMSRQLLSLANSGDTAGDKSQVVGYATLAFYE